MSEKTASKITKSPSPEGLVELIRMLLKLKISSKIMVLDPECTLVWRYYDETIVDIG